MTKLSFSNFGLAEPILRALEARNHVIPTPIQVAAIPSLLEGSDVLGIAQTGTGKTAAFALPLLNLLKAPRPKQNIRRPLALVLAPTRELALQIGHECSAYCSYLPIRQTVIFGGVNDKKQISALKRGLDIVIATPGRLLDLHRRKYVDFSGIKYFVLDEADRMLDMGFIHDVRKIIGAIPLHRQTLLFSATMPQEVLHLSEAILNNPLRVQVAPQATPVENIQQFVQHVPAGGKAAILSKVFNNPEFKRVIVFTRTKHRANRVAKQLAEIGVPADALHGNKSQAARQKALTRFKQNKCRALVATDIAARGIDIDGVTHVINYELPNEPESYIHRIGRTARAGAFGTALSFCEPSERKYLRDIERLIKKTLTVTGDFLEGSDALGVNPPQQQNSQPQKKIISAKRKSKWKKLRHKQRKCSGHRRKAANQKRP